MMRSWLQVLQWYWSGDQDFLADLKGTRLYEACKVGLNPNSRPQPEQQLQLDLETPLLDYINRLHAEKHAAYGDSWRRRGEPGILGNIARKVDRIGSGVGTSDEAQVDTAIDLVVYMGKYLLWLEGREEATPKQVELLLDEVPGVHHNIDFDKTLDDLFNMPAGKSDTKVRSAYVMLDQALHYARSLWR